MNDYKIDFISKPSRDFNEDGIITEHPIYTVFDGATSLKKHPNINTSEAEMLVRYLEKQLPLAYKHFQSFDQALKTLSKEYFKNNHNIYQNMTHKPSVGIAAAIDTGEHFELYVLGDCEIVYLNHNEKATRFSYYGLQALDTQAINEMKKIAKEKNISIADARKHIDDILLENRSLMNRLEGYQVFTPDKDPSFEIKHKRILKRTTKALFLYTDGFGQAFDTLKLRSGYSTLFHSKLNIDHIVDSINKTWNRDLQLNKHPRFKPKDDITVIKITLN